MSETTPLFKSGFDEYSLQFTPVPELNANIDYELITTKSPTESATLQLPAHLSNKVIVIDSITSGIGREQRQFYPNVLKPLLDTFKVVHQYVETKSSDTIKELIESLPTDNYTLIFISGDTSIYEFVNSLSSDTSTFKVSLVPLGTGNSLCHSANSLSESESIIKLFTSTSYKALPVYKVVFPEGTTNTFTNQITKSSYFVVCATWSFHAQLVYFAEQPDLRKLGLQRFKIAAQKAATTIDLKFKGETADSNFTVHSYFNLLTIPRIEKNYLISPDSDLFDNSLHLIDIDGTLPTDQLMQIMMLPYQQTGEHVKLPGVNYKRIDTEFKLKLKESDPKRSLFCVDGDVFEVEDPLDKEITVQVLKDQPFKLDLIV